MSEAAEQLVAATAEAAPTRETGIVKWFSAEKGYGFIQRNAGGADILVHHSAIQMKGYRTLYENQPVTFEVIASPKGLLAVRVIPE